MDKQYISIKEFAERVGKSQQAIYKQLNNKLKKYVKVVENKKYLHISALDEYIKPQDNSTDEQQLLNMLQTNLKVLQEELSAKNRQIEKLETLLSQEQQLRMVEHQQYLELKESIEQPPTEQEPIEPDEPPTPPKNFWAKIFKK